MAIVAAATILCSINSAKGQNIQAFYDFGRKCATTTAEMFHPDGGGSTYFFIDIDYAPRVTGAYWEISRELNFWQKKLPWLSVHLEYNGGLNRDAGSFNNAFLTGLTYSGHSADFSKTWSITASYKIIPGTIGLNEKKQIHNFQITGVWSILFAKGWCTFSGFIDFWREPRSWQGTNFILLAEPQFWVNLNRIPGWSKVKLSVGGEVELSNNFVTAGFKAMPAVGLKWTFR